MKQLTGAIGYLLVGLFIYLAVMKGTSNPEIFFNIHGIAIVIGGLFVATLASFPYDLIVSSLRSVWKSLRVDSRTSAMVAEQVVSLGSALQKNLIELEKESVKVKHSFLTESVNLILEGLNPATITEIMNKRIEEKRQQISSQMNVMLTLSKYSPGLGLAATVLGLVDLLSQLQSADMAKLGYGMAIALSATFYGIILSNLVFAPLSEMIASVGETECKEMEMIRDGLQAALERKHALIVGEIVNSYLEESVRVDFVGRIQAKGAA